MKLDVPQPRPTWTARLPGGRRTTLRLAPGVRLCVGDMLRIGRTFYRVDRRLTAADSAVDGGARTFVVEVSRAPAQREAATA